MFEILVFTVVVGEEQAMYFIPACLHLNNACAIFDLAQLFL